MSEIMTMDPEPAPAMLRAPSVVVQIPPAEDNCTANPVAAPANDTTDTTIGFTVRLPVLYTRNTCRTHVCQFSSNLSRAYTCAFTWHISEDL